MKTIQEAMDEFPWQTQGKGSNKTYQVSAGSVSVHGSSKTEVFTKLLYLIRRAMSADYHPRLIVFRGWHVIIYCTPLATFVFGPQRGEPFDPYHGSGPYTTREFAERRVRMDLACLAWDGKEETSPVILTASDQQEFRERCSRRERNPL